MTSTYETHEEAFPATFRHSWQAGEQLLSTSETDDASMQYTYFSVDSTNMTASNLPGAGRLLGNLYSRLGRSLEYTIFARKARRRGADPQEVAARIRGMAVWQTPVEAKDSLPFRQHLLELNDLKLSDAKVLRRCCRAIIYYMCFGSHETVTSALQEMIDLSIRYFPVREAFITVQAVDALRLLPLYIKRVGSYDSQQLRTVESMAEKAHLCLQDNAIYSACRETFLDLSCISELDTAKLSLVLESLTEHGQIHFIATDLLFFFQLTSNEPDDRSLSGVIERLSFRRKYENKYLVGIEDMHQDQSDILMRHCQALLDCTKSRFPRVQIAALSAITKLSKQYRSIREALKVFDAEKDLINIKEGHVKEAVIGFKRLDEIQDLASKALFSLQDNEVYDAVKKSGLRKPWAPEVEGAVLRLELENFLLHPELKTIASEHLSLLQLSYTFDSFTHYARHLLDPISNRDRVDKKENISIARVACALVKFATGPFRGPEVLEIRVKACSHIENMIFGHPSSRTYFNDADLSGHLVKVTDALLPPDSGSSHENREIGLFLKLSARITLCLQDHKVFPRTSTHVSGLDNSILDTIFNYLRTPELFFIGAKVLSKSWSKEFCLSNTFFCRIVCFLLDSLEEMAKYAEAQILVFTVLEKILFVGPILGLPGVYAEFVDALSSAKYATLYPVSHRTIQEYRIRAMP